MPAFLLALLLAATPAIPNEAAIVDSHESYGDHDIGNVLVTFTDGHHEKWTKHGGCMVPRVADSGLVGWARVVAHLEDGTPSFSPVRVCWPDGHYKDVGFIDCYPYFTDWCFAAHDTAVVIESNYKHGPDRFVEYELKTGKVMASSQGKIPPWAPGLNHPPGE